MTEHDMYLGLQSNIEVLIFILKGILISNLIMIGVKLGDSFWRRFK